MTFLDTLKADLEGRLGVLDAEREAIVGALQALGGTSNGAVANGTPANGTPTNGRRWTRDTIIAAIRRWKREHGTPPRVEDWANRQDNSSVPHPRTVSKHFGSWGAAIEAAGFARPKRGRPKTHLNALRSR